VLLVPLLCASWLVAAEASGAGAASDAGIPDRPEALRFPPLSYRPPHARDHRVVLPGAKVPVYLFPDRSLPVVRLFLYVRVGAFAVPPGKEGLKEFYESLLTRGGVGGKSSMNGEDFDVEMHNLGAELRVSVGDTQTQLSLESLSESMPAAMRLLRSVLVDPLFDELTQSRTRNTLRARMLQRNDNSVDIEARERSLLAFGADHFTNRLMTWDSVRGVTRDDLVAFHQAYVHPGNMVVAVSGDFDRGQMIEQLEALLASPRAPRPQGPPFARSPGEVPAPKSRSAPGVYLVDKPGVNQGRVSLLLPGIQRDDPDYPASQVLNYILGGGGRTSRLSLRLRSEEGLVYEATSRFPGGVYYPDALLVQLQSQPRTCAYAVALVLDELDRLRKDGVSEDEVRAARTHLVDTLPQRFRTGALAAATLAGEEVTLRLVRDPDHWQRLGGRFDRVSKQEVDRVARRFLDKSQAIVLLVGPKDGILAPDPGHPVSLQSIAARIGPAARITELPLRDPLTLVPETSR
jgi:predicted Zn-dependent peptidase